MNKLYLTRGNGYYNWGEGGGVTSGPHLGKTDARSYAIIPPL